MLFYRTVRLILTHGAARQLIERCGPDLAVRIAENTHVDTILVDQNMVVASQDVGKATERHWPVGIKLGEPYEAVIVRLFREATGKSGRGRRLAERFLHSTRSYTLPMDDLTEATGRDWQDSAFMRQATTEALNEFAPSCALPRAIGAALTRQEDGSYAFKASTGWPVASDLTPARLLVSIADMREDLHLAAAFAAGVAQDPLGARLTRAKCSDLTAALDIQHSKIDQFHEIVVRGLTDLRGAVNSGACTFSDFLRTLDDAEDFRAWLDTLTPDADLVKSYYQEATKKRAINSRAVKELRWLIPVAAGFALFLPDAVLAAPSVAAALAATDRFVISRLAEGWRPAIFIDAKLRPLVNQ
jgi:hypothetical protein